jgi:hypothetical protein
MPVDNEPKHGGVAEPIRRFMAGDINQEEKEKNGKQTKKALRFLIGRNVLTDYYVYRECIELSPFSDIPLSV